MSDKVSDKVSDQTIQSACEFDYESSSGIIQKIGNPLDRYGAGKVTIHPADQIMNVKVTQAEFIAYNNQPIDYPSDQLKAKNSDFKGIEGE